MIKQIGIFSGKGGVGKTSITASLTTLLEERGIKLIAVDCDVDAPNLSIIFRKTAEIEDKLTVQTTEKATFLSDKCSHCQLCIDEHFCEFNALSWDEDKLVPVIDDILCEGCSSCHWLCPEHAFEIAPVDSGTIIRASSKYSFPITTGETILGAQSSGKLVTELKNYSMNYAKENNIELMVIDGPPGIGCPVIAAASDLKYGIIVLEPTGTALHDAARLMEVFEPFGFKYGIIINKSTLWPDGVQMIKDFAKERNIEILGELPLDPEWPNSIAKAEPVVKITSTKEVIEGFEKIVDNLLEKL